MPDISYTTPGLDTEQSTRVIDLLQYRLAAYNDLHLTLKHVHWNVVGPNFIAVHEMIDPQVELVRGFADEVAERIATMGGSPGGTTGDIARVRDWDDYALRRFDGTALYEYADPREGFHQDWNTLIYNFGRTEVANFLVANAVYWLDEYHVDGLRVDAVASMLYRDYSRKAGEWVPNAQGGRENLEAIEFLQDLNRAVYREHPDTVSIAEESTAWPMVSRPTDMGGLGFGMKWNMGWMHDTLAYFSRDPMYRRHHQGQLTFSMVYAFDGEVPMPAQDANAGGAPVPTAGVVEQGSSATGTNVQEVGVDEPDVVKTDGVLLVRVRDGDLEIHDVTGRDPVEVADVDLPGADVAREVLLAGDTVVVLSDNVPETLELYWAGVRMGLYVTFVNSHLTAPEASTASSASTAVARLQDTVRALTARIVEEPELAAAVTPALLGTDPDVARLRLKIGGEFLARFEAALVGRAPLVFALRYGALADVGGWPLLVWRCSTPWLAISSAPHGGGLGERSWVFNATVHRDYDNPDPDAHAAEIAGELGLTGTGIGLLTAVDVRHARLDEVVTISVGRNRPMGPRYVHVPTLEGQQVALEP